MPTTNDPRSHGANPSLEMDMVNLWWVVVRQLEDQKDTKSTACKTSPTVLQVFSIRGGVYEGGQGRMHQMGVTHVSRGEVKAG